MLKQFFLICSGSDTDILKSCSDGEQNKYAGIGATVFFTAVMAFIASSYALYTVFDNILASVFFGFVWGLLIFNLDRFIVSTIKKRGSVIDELIQASPRIILAVIIAVVISIKNDIIGLQNSVNAKEAEVNALYDVYVGEAEGTSGTNLLGKGPVYKEKREKHDAGLAELQQLKKETKEKIAATEA